MPSSWETKTLPELGELNRGKSKHRPRDAAHLYGGKYPFLQTGDIKASGGRVTSHSQTYSEYGLAQSRLWPAGTVAITIAANIAETGILTYPACFPDSIVGFVADPEVCDPRFIEYCFQHLRRAIQGEYVGSGSVQDNINLRVLSQLKFPAPPLAEQRTIADLLGALDDKIELNRRMNETLETMAQAIFRDWFVDFGPTRRKLEGATDPVTIMGGLVQNAERAQVLADFFPECIRGDGLPEGWREVRVGDVAVLKGGKQLEKEAFSEDGENPVFGGAGVMGRTHKWNADGIVITVGRVGAYCGCFVFHRGRAWVNNNASLVVPSTQLSGDFLFLALKNLNMETIKKGAAQPFVSNGDIANLRLVMPSPEVCEAADRFLLPLLTMMENNIGQSVTLAATRDLLLPKLMSGEIRLREAEEMLEAAQ